MRPVYIVGCGQIPVRKEADLSLRQMAAQAVSAALSVGGLEPEHIDALFAASMLSDELQGQKNLAALIADEVSLSGIEAFECRAATAAGAAALRTGVLAVGSGAARTVLVIGVEKMSEGVATPVLAKALDAEREVPDGATLLSRNAELMSLYLRRYRAPEDALAPFSVNAHDNARHNPNALYRDRQYSVAEVVASRPVSPPIRLLDCSPICDGAAAVILTGDPALVSRADARVRILASTGATDRFRSSERVDPLAVDAARRSAEAAYGIAGVGPEAIDFFEVHDAFSIMACLLLEACGFAPRGQAWRAAHDGAIRPDGSIPLSTRGGLKARGHPIGATALYQVSEIWDQLCLNAGGNQLDEPRTALMQSVGGVATAVFTHLFQRE